MIYILSIFVIFIAILVIINYLRKLHWDVIHHNLLELVDDIGGKILRQGMLGRRQHRVVRRDTGNGFQNSDFRGFSAIAA